MPKYSEMTEAELTQSERVQVQNEKDVFETKLNTNEKDLLESIMSGNQDKVSLENPVSRDVDTYKTPTKLSETEQQLYDYILADRSLKGDDIFTAQELAPHLDNKGKHIIL
jgi:hypothetical protein